MLIYALQMVQNLLKYLKNFESWSKEQSRHLMIFCCIRTNISKLRMNFLICLLAYASSTSTMRMGDWVSIRFVLYFNIFTFDQNYIPIVVSYISFRKFCCYGLEVFVTNPFVLYVFILPNVLSLCSIFRTRFHETGILSASHFVRTLNHEFSKSCVF